MADEVAVPSSNVAESTMEVLEPPAGEYQLGKAWWFHGGSTIIPNDGYQLVAIHLTGPSSYIRIWFFEGEKLLETDLQRVSVDERRAPINRFDTTMVEAHPEQFVVIGAIPKTTLQLRVVVGELHAPRLDQTVAVESIGGNWPPNPESQVLKVSEIDPRTLRLLIKSRHVLPDELPGPVLRRQLERGQEIQTGEPKAVVLVRRDGEPIVAKPLAPSQWRFLVLDYDWPSEGGLPQQFTCVQEWCDLPAPSPWPHNPRLSQAMQKSQQLSSRDQARAASGFPPLTKQ